MSSLGQTDISAIVALLALRDPDHIVDLDVLANLTGDSIDNLDNSDTQRIDTGCFILNVNSKEKDHHTCMAKR
jgi:hypothetical protein